MEQKRNCDIDLRLEDVLPLLSPGLRHYPDAELIAPKRSIFRSAVERKLLPPRGNNTRLY